MKQKYFQTYPNRALSVILLSLISLFPGCKKFVSIPPPKTQLSSSLVFQNDADAISTVSGIYSSMSNTTGF